MSFDYKDTLPGSPTVTGTPTGSLFTAAAQQETWTAACVAPTGVSISPSGSQTNIVGDSLTLTASTTGGTSPLHYQWKKGATNVGTDSPTFTINSLATTDSGTYSVLVSNACGSNVASSNNLVLTVNNPVTTTAVATSGTPSIYGSSVTFTATVTANSGTPAGSVNFYNGGTCSTPGPQIGTTQTLNGSAQASVSTSSLAVGSYTILACYTHTGNFTDSNGSTAQTVNPAVTATAISAPTITYGADGSVTVTVSSSSTGAGTPTGSVSLAVDGGTAVTKALSSGSYTFAAADIAALTKPSVPSHSLSASYAERDGEHLHVQRFWLRGQRHGHGGRRSE